MPPTNSTRRYPTLVVTKYMGSKKAILPFVADEIERLTKPGDIVVDLMAGTHTLGYAMKNRCRIVANDVQRFSLVIGYTLLNYKPNPRFAGQMLDAFRRFYVRNLRHLESLFESGLHRERQFLAQLIDNPSRWKAYAEFCENYPFFTRPNPVTDIHDEFKLLFSPRRIEAYKALHKLEPYSLFSLYYANSYIGVCQAAEIDSLRYAIDKLCDQWLPEQDDIEVDNLGMRCLLLSALIATLNRLNPGPGHYAAYPVVRAQNFNRIAIQRALGTYDLFINKVSDIETALEKNQSPYTPHIVMTEDYTAFIEEMRDYIHSARVIYLDPPYSQGHYSRFYHLLETLVHYDYPDIAHKGRYRTDRHRSAFAYREKAASAIGQVCDIARAAKAVLVISYSKGGTIPNGEALYTILKKYYPPRNIQFKQLSSVHSKLGQAKRMATEEYLFTCKP